MEDVIASDSSCLGGRIRDASIGTDEWTAGDGSHETAQSLIFIIGVWNLSHVLALRSWSISICNGVEETLDNVPIPTQPSDIVWILVIVIYQRKLQNGRRVDHSTVSLPMTTSSCCFGLLKDGEPISAAPAPHY